MLVVDTHDKYRIIHSSYTMDINVGDFCYFAHDQTRQRIGERWRVVATRPHTKQGLKELGEIAGKKSLSMSTFK